MEELTESLAYLQPRSRVWGGGAFFFTATPGCPSCSFDFSVICTALEVALTVVGTHRLQSNNQNTFPSLVIVFLSHLPTWSSNA